MILFNFFLIFLISFLSIRIFAFNTSKEILLNDHLHEEEIEKPFNSNVDKIDIFLFLEKNNLIERVNSSDSTDCSDGSSFG